MIKWVSEEDVPGREKKGTKQTDRKPEKFCFDKHAEFLSGRVD